MNDWMREFRKALEDAKNDTDKEMKSLRKEIEMGMYSKEQKKMVCNFVNLFIKSQLKEIDENIDEVDENDIETLSALLEVVRFLKDVEVELLSLLEE